MPDPTPEEIRAHCERILGSLSEREREAKLKAKPTSWEIPTVDRRKSIGNRSIKKDTAQ